MTKCHVIFDEMGYSTTVAKVEFEKEEDASKAIDELNEAEIEKVPIRLEICCENDFRFSGNFNSRQKSGFRPRMKRGVGHR